MLLGKIKHYCATTGMPKTKFGRLAAHDPRLIGDMERGRRLGARVAAQVERFMTENRP